MAYADLSRRSTGLLDKYRLYEALGPEYAGRAERTAG